jgi:hypothetical protein
MQGWQGYTTMATRARQGASFVHGLRAQQACQDTCCMRGRHARSRHGSRIKTCQTYEAIGVDQVMLIMQTETIPHAKVMGSIEKFGKEVIPAFQGTRPRRGWRRLSKGAYVAGDTRAWARGRDVSCPSEGNAPCRQGQQRYGSITCHMTRGG